METNGRPFGAECMAALCLEKGEKELCESKRNLIAAFRALNIEAVSYTHLLTYPAETSALSFTNKT